MPTIRRMIDPDDNLKEAMFTMAGLLDEKGYYNGKSLLSVKSTDKQVLEKTKTELLAGTIVQRKKNWYLEFKGKYVIGNIIRQIGPLMQNKEKLEKWVNFDPDILTKPLTPRIKTLADVKPKIKKEKPEIEYIYGTQFESDRERKIVYYMLHNFVWLEILEGSPYIIFTGTKEVLQDLKRDAYLDWSPFIDWRHDGKIYNAVELKEFPKVIEFITRLGYCTLPEFVPRPWIKAITDYYSFLPENQRGTLRYSIAAMHKACAYQTITQEETKYQKAAKLLAKKSWLTTDESYLHLVVTGSSEELEDFLTYFDWDIPITSVHKDNHDYTAIEIKKYEDIIKVITCTGPYTDNKDRINAVLDVYYVLPEIEKKSLWPDICAMCEANGIRQSNE